MNNYIEEFFDIASRAEQLRDITLQIDEQVSGAIVKMG